MTDAQLIITPEDEIVLRFDGIGTSQARNFLRHCGHDIGYDKDSGPSVDKKQWHHYFPKTREVPCDVKISYAIYHDPATGEYRRIRDEFSKHPHVLARKIPYEEQNVPEGHPRDDNYYLIEDPRFRYVGRTARVEQRTQKVRMSLYVAKNRVALTRERNTYDIRARNHELPVAIEEEEAAMPAEDFIYHSQAYDDSDKWLKANFTPRIYF